MKKILNIIGLLCIITLLICSCQSEPVTTTVTDTTTETESKIITKTPEISTITSTVMSTVTSIKTITTTLSSDTTTETTSSSTTTSPIVTTTEYTVVDGLITSMDGKLQILSHRMDYGITPGLRIQIKNISTSVVSAEIVAEIMHSYGPEQITEIVSDLQPGEIRSVSMLVVGYYDTEYEILVLRTIS